MALIDQAKDIQSEIDVTFQTAYRALQKANIELGISYVQEAGESIPVEDSIEIKARSIMGTEIPLVRFHKKQEEVPTYAFTAQKNLWIRPGPRSTGLKS